MTEDGVLFPAPPPVPSQRSGLGADAQRTARQARLIAAGLHPLTLVARQPVRLHPDASRDPQDRRGPGPRCGGCLFRLSVMNRSRTYTKCVVGAPWRPGDGQPQVMDLAPRATRGPASDTRGWWPACESWEARP